MIIFTRHAREKFSVLSESGFLISEEAVLTTLLLPDIIDHARLPLLIAQKVIDATHVLRVVYREEGKNLIIITFYPGKRKYYE